MKVLWTNAVPNSPFSARPVLLVAQKENETTVKSFFDKLINPDTNIIDCDDISLPMGHVNVNLTRCLFDGKMSGILSRVGGAHCPLCTATFAQLHDFHFVRFGFPINREISSAIQIFEDVTDKDSFLSQPSESRFGLTHEPISSKNILSSSPLHSISVFFDGSCLSCTILMLEFQNGLHLLLMWILLRFK